ncbi:MAG: hypothetical protein U0637_15280 [Phycisphaerales bacterium]
MSCEERFAAVGRRIDDLVYAITSRRKPSIRVGPSLGERFQGAVHSAQDWAATQRSRVSPEQIEQMDPRTRMAIVVVCAMLVGGAAVGIVVHFAGGGGGGSLTPEEVQRLEKMRGSGGMSMFATPPAPAEGAKSKPADRPGAGSLTGGR